MKLFGKRAEKQTTEAENSIWNDLNAIEQLDMLVETSKAKSIGIFKHSTRCGISRMVKKQFEKDFNAQDSVDLYYLDLLTYRPISTAIAERFDVVHESPQLLILKDGVVVENASHHDILEMNL